jgi:hypothetical protein
LAAWAWLGALAAYHASYAAGGGCRLPAMVINVLVDVDGFVVKYNFVEWME